MREDRLAESLRGIVKSAPDIMTVHVEPLSFGERLAHAWRVRSLCSACAALVDAGGRRLLGPERWRLAPWYAGRLGGRVHTDALAIETPTRYLAGVLWLGGFEVYERYLAITQIPPDLPVIEIGAGLGFVSCLVNRRLHDRTQHVCVEANPAALPLLRKNRDINGCRFELVHAALAYDADSVQMGIDEFVAESAIGDREKPQITVPTITLDQIAAAAGFDRFTLICDIEGAEVSLIEREGHLLAARVPTIMMEVHPHLLGEGRVAELKRRLCGELNYRLAASKANVWILKNRDVPPRE